MSNIKLKRRTLIKLEEISIISSKCS